MATITEEITAFSDDASIKRGIDLLGHELWLSTVPLRVTGATEPPNVERKTVVMMGGRDLLAGDATLFASIGTGEITTLDRPSNGHRSPNNRSVLFGMLSAPLRIVTGRIGVKLTAMGLPILSHPVGRLALVFPMVGGAAGVVTRLASGLVAGTLARAARELADRLGISTRSAKTSGIILTHQITPGALPSAVDAARGLLVGIIS